MPTRSILLALLLLGAASAPRAQQSPICAPQGVMTFLCGVEAAEDSVGIPGTHWLIAGGLGFGGAGTLKLVDTVSGRVRVLYPAAGAAAPDSGRYADCSGPPDAADFSTVGLALARPSRRELLLYAVNDGARHAVEVFRLDTRGTEPKLIWIGCALLPARTNGNAVTALPGRGFAVVSMDDGSAERMAQHVAGAATGSVYEWQPRTGLTQLTGLVLHGGNGIVASPDGRWLYVSAWSGGEIVRISRDGSAPPTTVRLGYLPDNLKWAADGSILVAAQRPPVAAIAACTGPECIVDWLIAKLDPETLAARTLVEVEGSPAVNYATGVTELGGALYVTNRGLNRIGVIPAAALAGVEPLRISAPSR
jgi:hypothetical protein